MHIHNPTEYDPSPFVFDNTDERPCPLLHFRASHIALMVEAEPHLSKVTRLLIPKGDIAEAQVTTLLRLYRRQPGPCSSLAAISVQSEYKNIYTQVEANSRPSARILTAIPSSPPLMTSPPTHLMSFTKDPMPGLTLNSSDSTVVSQTEDGGDPYAGDKQLAEYAKEQSVTWEDLSNRPPLFGGEEQGPWRFASAEDICRSKQLWGFGG